MSTLPGQDIFFCLFYFVQFAILPASKTGCKKIKREKQNKTGCSTKQVLNKYLLNGQMGVSGPQGIKWVCLGLRG
jgi:hypothetical protein